MIVLGQDDDRVSVTVQDETGGRSLIAADYALGCDGPRSVIRGAIGAAYVGEQAMRPNLGMVFHAPELLARTAHGPAVQYWILNQIAPAIMGPIDLHGTFQTRVIAAAAANNSVLATDLLTADIGAPGAAGDRARTAAHLNIQATKHAEFHALSLVLDLAYERSPVIAADGPGPELGDDDDPVTEARPGARLPHAWIGSGQSIYDELGDGMTLLALEGGHVAEIARVDAAARDRGVPLRVVGQEDRELRARLACALVLVRPDQHVAWCGDRVPADVVHLIDLVRGADPRRQNMTP